MMMAINDAPIVAIPVTTMSDDTGKTQHSAVCVANNEEGIKAGFPSREEVELAITPAATIWN